MVCNPVARYCKVIILSSSERKVDLYRYQCNNLLLSSAIEDDWRVAKSPRVVLLRILEQMDQLHNLEYQVSILRLPASISRIGTATTVILSNRPGIWLPPFCDDLDQCWASPNDRSRTNIPDYLFHMLLKPLFLVNRVFLSR